MLDVIAGLSALDGGATHSVKLPPPTTTFVEFCSGRGTLSERLQQTVMNSLGGTTDHAGLGCIAPDSFVLVDWAAFKGGRCRDSNLRTRGAHVQRITADVAALDLGRVPLAREAERVVGFSKHACGPATDAVIRCITSFDMKRVVGSDPGTVLPPQRTSGTAVVIAPCCHHRCSWASYSGKEMFEGMFGLQRDDFFTAVALSGWATLVDSGKPEENTCGDDLDDGSTCMTCSAGASTQTRRAHGEVRLGEPGFTSGTGSGACQTSRIPSAPSPGLTSALLVSPAVGAVVGAAGSPVGASREPLGHALIDPIDPIVSDTPLSSTPFLPSRSDKIWIGQKCKQLLDLGRVEALKSSGQFDSVHLIKYTTRSVEDRLVVAIPKETHTR